jgi:2-dehydro-3-deoxyglucarate aldolase
MNRREKISLIRENLKSGKPSIGSWMQIPNSSIAEIMGMSGYDWIAIDLEHGTIDVSQLPDLFRALELGNTLPLVRLAQGLPKDCKRALDAGAGCVIVPMVESAEQLNLVKDACRWPPSGNRGVGFSRANLFGKYFEDYRAEAQEPILVAMIEHIEAVENLESILKVEGLDAILVGPYDLSASMGITGKFQEQIFSEVMTKIRVLSNKFGIPFGMHVVAPQPESVQEKIKDGYQFIAYSIDAVFMSSVCQNPISNLPKTKVK